MWSLDYTAWRGLDERGYEELGLSRKGTEKGRIDFESFTFTHRTCTRICKKLRRKARARRSRSTARHW